MGIAASRARWLCHWGAGRDDARAAAAHDVGASLGLTLGHPKESGLVLGLGGFSSLFALAPLSAARWHLSFANIVALALLLGTGVDKGIPMIHWMRHAPPERGGFLATGTARAVLASERTTICDSGNLPFSPHLRMSSTSVWLALGLVFPLLTTLIVLPKAVAWRRDARPVHP